MNLLRLICICHAALLLICSASQAAPQNPVRVGIYDFAPLCSMKADQATGFFVKLLREIASEEGWDLVFLHTRMTSNLERLTNAEIDLLPAAPFSPEEDTRFDFNRETVISTWAQLYRSPGTEIHSLLDLSSRSVGVVRGDPYNQEIRGMIQRLNITSNFVEFNHYQDVLEALAHGWIEAGVVDRLFGSVYGNTSKVIKTAIIFSPREYRFAVPKGRHKQLIAAVDYHLERWKTDPDSLYHRGLEALFRDSGTSKLLHHLQWGLLAALGGLVLISGLNFYLRRLVKQQTLELTRKNDDLAQEVDMRRHAEQELRESRERLETIFHCVPAGILIIDAENRTVQDANAAAADLTGMGTDRLRGRSCTFLRCGPSADSSASSDRSAPDCPARGRGDASYTSECGLCTVQGEVVPVLKTVQPIQMGGKSCFLESFIDIRELKSAEAQKRQLEVQLQHSHKMQAIGVLAGGIAHDFNNILTPILGYTEMALTTLTETHPARPKLEEVTKAAQRAKELVRQILAFGRRDTTEQFPMEVQPVVKEALKFISATLPSTIRIRQSICEDPIFLIGNPSQIHQVLMNLCTNAFHAMQETGGELQVELKRLSKAASYPSGSPEGSNRGYFRLTVRDTGCGMKPEVSTRVFEPYFTTKPQGEGSGLGLSVVHGIIKTYDGHISVESKPGKGAVFRIDLPEMEAPETIKREVKPEVSNRAAASDRGVGHILLVDDEPHVLNSLREMVSFLGYRVTALGSGAAALKKFRNQPEVFDLVMTDMTMPDMTGAELARALLDMRADLPIILCSGYSESSFSKKFKSPKICDYLVKPLRIKELADALQKALHPGTDRKHLPGTGSSRTDIKPGAARSWRN
jgi:PAS domain S-box-containing protein